MPGLFQGREPRKRPSADCCVAERRADPGACLHLWRDTGLNGTDNILGAWPQASLRHALIVRYIVCGVETPRYHQASLRDVAAATGRVSAIGQALEFRWHEA